MGSDVTDRTSASSTRASQSADMSSMSATSSTSGNPFRRGELHSHALVAADEVGGPVSRFGWVHQAQVGEPIEHLLEDDAQLEAGEAGAQAEVRPEAEGDVLVRRATDVELEWIREHGFIAIGRRIEQQELL